MEELISRKQNEIIGALKFLYSDEFYLTMKGVSFIDLNFYRNGRIIDLLDELEKLENKEK